MLPSMMHHDLLVTHHVDFTRVYVRSPYAMAIVGL
jgi:hypothetical protein